MIFEEKSMVQENLAAYQAKF